MLSYMGAMSSCQASTDALFTRTVPIFDIDALLMHYQLDASNGALLPLSSTERT
jgi:hypothetical protein